MIQKNTVFTISLYALATLLALTLHSSPIQAAGPYGDSAHGDSVDGVERTGVPSPPYVTGNCTHCHEQHASLEGSEPAPTSGSPSPYALFAGFNTASLTSYNQSDNFCFYCHTGSGSLQTGGISNQDYATTFGSSTPILTAGIFEAFNLYSYHNLYDISVFSKIQFPSHFSSATNPCMACHNPHRAKRNRSDPGDPTLAAISRPESLGSHDSLWGDDDGTNNTTNERMDSYNYQPPLVSSNTYEPGGTLTADSSLTPDYNTFCTDCHNATNTIYSTALGRNLKKIDWNNEKHGKGNADGDIYVDSPYTPGSGSMSYVLACTDCHEPHGSANIFLIRQEVNGGILGGSITAEQSFDWRYLCARCHNDSNQNIHHLNFTFYTDEQPYIRGAPCGACHGGYFQGKIPCSNCHFHGSQVTDADNAPTTRRTF